MSFFISDALAQDAGQAGGPLEFMLPLLLMFGIFYFLLIRPQQKKQKAHAQLVSEIKIGDEIMTAGGILGRITGVSEHYAIVHIADDTEIKIQKASISQVVPKGTFEEA